MKELIRPPLFCPDKPTTTQSRFLATDSLEALFGYSAGGGKTTALLMAALQYVDIPGYNAVIFRRSFRDLFLPGAIGDRFYRWMSDHNEKMGEWVPERIGWVHKTNTAIFPSGAKLHFGYLGSPDDHLRYKSGEYQFIGIDQVEEVGESDYLYLLSRLRRPNTGPTSLVPLRMRATATWGTEWIEERFVAHLDRTIILSTLENNPHIDQEAYRAALETVNPIDRQKLSVNIVMRERTPEEERQLIERITKSIRDRLNRNFRLC